MGAGFVAGPLLGLLGSRGLHLDSRGVGGRELGGELLPERNGNRPVMLVRITVPCERTVYSPFLGFPGSSLALLRF
jgi:hypothetical protein